MSQAQARLAKFQIDGMDQLKFEGYTLGETWKGWARPYFTYEQAHTVAKVFNEQTVYESSYTPSANTFVFKNKIHVDENYSFTSETLILGGVETKVYPIGAGSWVWTECEPEMTEKDLLESVIHWTMPGFIEGKRNVLDNYENAVQHLQQQDVFPRHYTYPTLP